jgi:tetratricopeptide (TPR) repeat protein
LQHPGVPAVHDLGTLPDGRPFLAMKLIKGRTLADLLEGGGPANLVAVFEQVCQAVAYAHAHGVIHRDLKPANVMVGAFGEVQVMDWGLAKVLAGGAAEQAGDDPEATTAAATEIQAQRGAAEATRAGSVLGTPAYMPPEQAIGAVDQIDARSDVFGLGALLCAVLTGKPPYVGTDSESTRQLAARAKLDDAFARLDGCGAEPELVALCKRCLAAEKAERPADGGAVAREVAALRAAAEERARQAELERVRAEAEARGQGKRRRAQLGLAAALGLLLLGGGAFAWYWDREATQRRFEQLARLERNAQELEELVGRCEEALREGDIRRAALALEHAERRLEEGGAENVQERVDRCVTDLALLRELNAVDTFRWTPVNGTVPPDSKTVASKLRSALVGYGLSAAQVRAGEAVRVTRSLVRERLLTALDLCLYLEPMAPVRDVLRAADPDAYREAVRDAVAAGNGARQAELAGRPAALKQPPWFAAVLGQNQAVVAERRRAVLGEALRTRPGDLSLLMEMGESYPRQGEGVAERLRWFQAAVAAHPLNAVARFNLGGTLRAKGDLDGAVASYRDALRLEPKYATVRICLVLALDAKKDPDELIAFCREAVRIDPKDTSSHHNLGNALRKKGDLDGAVTSPRAGCRRRTTQTG